VARYRPRCTRASRPCASTLPCICCAARRSQVCPRASRCPRRRIVAMGRDCRTATALPVLFGRFSAADAPVASRFLPTLDTGKAVAPSFSSRIPRCMAISGLPSTTSRRSRVSARACAGTPPGAAKRARFRKGTTAHLIGLPHRHDEGRLRHPCHHQTLPDKADGFKST